MPLESMNRRLREVDHHAAGRARHRLGDPVACDRRLGDVELAGHVRDHDVAAFLDFESDQPVRHYGVPLSTQLTLQAHPSAIGTRRHLHLVHERPHQREPAPSISLPRRAPGAAIAHGQVHAAAVQQAGDLEGHLARRARVLDGVRGRLAAGGHDLRGLLVVRPRRSAASAAAARASTASASGAASNSLRILSVIGTLRRASSATSSRGVAVGHERGEQVVAQRLRVGARRRRPPRPAARCRRRSPSPGRSTRPSV